MLSEQLVVHDFLLQIQVMKHLFLLLFFGNGNLLLQGLSPILDGGGGEKFIDHGVFGQDGLPPLRDHPEFPNLTDFSFR